MNGTGRILFFLAQERQRQAWEQADAWRLLHARPDAEPLPEATGSIGGATQRPAFSLTFVRRLLARGA